MRNKIILITALIGIISGVGAALFYGHQKKPQKPVFNPAPNPYEKGIYSVGIVESYQSNGQNTNIYPEVQGRVLKVYVKEGQVVKQDDPLLMLDDSVQRADTEQKIAQAEAALSTLNELKAQPRKEVLNVSKAEMESAQASLKNVRDQLNKQTRAYRLNPRSVSTGALDDAKNAVKIAEKKLDVAKKNYELTKAGAWIFDIKNQENQYIALSKSAKSAMALLDKYIIRAPTDGVILSIQTTAGSLVTPQGAYNTYTQGLAPVMVMGGNSKFLQIRSYVDEILINKLPPPSEITGQMFIRGTNTKIPLEFVRIQPYVTPKIELSNQRSEKVDVRVLPVIFKFSKSKEMNIYPGQLVDVYMGGHSINIPREAQEERKK